MKQLNIDKKDYPFKIRVVVMTKDAAAAVCEAAVCEALSAESISRLMLTSDCLQSKKEDMMLAWEEVSQLLMALIMEGWKMSLYTGQAILCFD